MAIDKYESQIQHSLYGRKFGLDNGGFAVALPGVRIPTEVATTADAATPLTGYGVSALTGSTAQYLLAAPAAIGIEKIVVNASTLSTARMTLVRSTANGACAFGGSTANGAASGVAITMDGNAASIRLIAISTSVWQPIGNIGTFPSTRIAMNITTSS